jgi:protein-S-isoprenylcysteine O-methyltransferase Ste14
MAELVIWIAQKATEIYDAGGPAVRWIIWFWVAFVFLYWLLGKYEKIHSSNIIEKRESIKQNYYYTLHIYGVFGIIFLYGDKLGEWEICYHLVSGDGSQKVAYAFGIVFVILGLLFVIWGRLYLNGYWGKDCYMYDDESTYELVTEAPYKLCRHPIYFGQICMVWGTALALNNIMHYIFALIITAVNSLRAKNEDKFLHEIFGVKWEAYKDKTSWILPISFGKR